MRKRNVFYTELAYVLGIAALALGTALMERADFGMSMVVAPAYLLHRRLSEALPWYSFGVSEYVLQAALLLVLSALLRRWKKAYLFSFVTAVVYGLTLDGCMALAAYLPAAGLAVRGVWYVLGMAVCALGVALLFRTYLPPEAYELFVKELAEKLGKDASRVKTVYDCCSCALGVALSFAFFGFGRFVGVRAGTILCALVNGRLIGWIGAALDRRFVYRDALPLRNFFRA